MWVIQKEEGTEGAVRMNIMPFSPDSRNKRGRESLWKGEAWKKEQMKRGVYSLGSQHTVTRNFIHGRGGPSSVGRAGKNKERERFKYAAHLLKPDKRFVKRHMRMLNEISTSNLLFGGLSWIISWIIKTRKAEQQWSCFSCFYHIDTSYNTQYQ